MSQTCKWTFVHELWITMSIQLFFIQSSIHAHLTSYHTPPLSPGAEIICAPINMQSNWASTDCTSSSYMWNTVGTHHDLKLADDIKLLFTLFCPVSYFIAQFIKSQFHLCLKTFLQSMQSQVNGSMNPIWRFEGEKDELYISTPSRPQKAHLNFNFCL